LDESNQILASQIKIGIPTIKIGTTPAINAQTGNVSGPMECMATVLTLVIDKHAGRA
jgi:hypothetical protein